MHVHRWIVRFIDTTVYTDDCLVNQTVNWRYDTRRQQKTATRSTGFFY
mgnify:CR=1 FL=1